MERATRESLLYSKKKQTTTATTKTAELNTNTCTLQFRQVSFDASSYGLGGVLLKKKKKKMTGSQYSTPPSL